MAESYIVRISSQKGGVGKTVIAVNLAAVLKTLNYDVLLIDADTSNPSVATHLGLGSVETGYKEIVDTGAELGNELSSYGPIDINVIPGTISVSQYKPAPNKISEFYKKVRKEGYEVVIVDSAPGSFSEDEIRFFNEAMIVTIPELASARGSASLASTYERYHIRHRLVINRVQNDTFELTKENIEKIYGDVVYSILPDDPIIKQSISKRTPAYLLNPNSKFSMAIAELSRAYQLRLGEPEIDRKREGAGFRRRIRKFFGF
jgi:MinD-like ATPase involved in chromosome partitioning or flagellar assembly